MFKVVSCIAFDHKLDVLTLAVVVCVLGVFLMIRLYARAFRSQSIQRINWLLMSGIIGGSTIWTTHFIAMLSYKVELLHGYDPMLTIGSLVVAIVTTTAGLFISMLDKSGPTVEAGGAVLGLGIAAMHYLGMSAYDLAGHFEWNQSYVAASVVLGGFFGGVSMNRVARPLTRYCKFGAALALILAIVSMHFTGMAAITIVPDPTATISADVISSGLLIGMVVVIMTIMLGFGASSYIIDLQSSRIAAERFRHLSLHDPLTGLPNRAAFNERLGLSVSGEGRMIGNLAVLTIDLDRFKEVNDVHGHAAGDAVLRTLARRFGEIITDGEYIARIGGDEFSALTTNVFTKGDVNAFAQRLVSEISKPVIWEDRTFLVGCSIGISLFQTDATDKDGLVAHADLAMYRAKALGSNSVCFYDASMDELARDRSALAMDLRSAIERGEFELYYQYQNDSRTREVIGFEALLRWHHPVRGMVPPDEFIPIAEKTGFIHELGDWVILTACREAAGWDKPLKIAVNVAPAQLADINLPNRVREILVETGLSPSRLELEITESGILADQQNALHIVRSLKAMGVHIAMDDFGTGYSSLSTLQNFPFDKIKIDRGFIDGVTTNRQSAAIVRSTIILAQSLDIPVLAEGVENEEHMRFLCGEGCLQVQGYLFGRPAPTRDIQSIVNPGRSGPPLALPDGAVEEKPQAA